MPRWDQKLSLPSGAARTPKYKVFSIAVPYEQHAQFKKLVQSVVSKRGDVLTHEVVAAALIQYANR